MLPALDAIDKSKPLTDEQYVLISQLPNRLKSAYMDGFDPSGWSEKDIMRHYKSVHFPELRYHSAGGGGKGTLTPPRS